MSLYLVSCVGRKLSFPAPAKDLYDSSLFHKSRAYVEGFAQPWHILSAKYGLLDLDQVIDPYDLTLNKMLAVDRRRWAEMVMSQMQPHLDGVEAVVFLAGQRYREFLEPKLIERGIVVFVPMEGLTIGKQLSWLNAQIGA